MSGVKQKYKNPYTLCEVRISFHNTGHSLSLNHMGGFVWDNLLMAFKGRIGGDVNTVTEGR